MTFFRRLKQSTVPSLYFWIAPGSPSPMRSHCHGSDNWWNAHPRSLPSTSLKFGSITQTPSFGGISGNLALVSLVLRRRISYQSFDFDFFLSPYIAQKQDRQWTNLVRAVSTLDELAICLPNYEQVLPASSCKQIHWSFSFLSTNWKPTHTLNLPLKLDRAFWGKSAGCSLCWSSKKMN